MNKGFAGCCTSGSGAAVAGVDNLKVQRESCLETHGVTPAGRLERLGTLSARCSFVHCVWTDAADIDLFAGTKAVAVHNPHSNAKLGVGLMPLASMLNAGCEVALGTDGASTNDGLALHEAMALSLFLQRSDGTLPRHRWPTAKDALRMATQCGAAAMLLRDRIAVIARGAFADLVFYDVGSLDICPRNDLPSSSSLPNATDRSAGSWLAG